MANYQEMSADIQKQVTKILIIILGFIVSGLLIVGRQHWESVSITILWSLAWVLVGYFVGFIFAIPRIVQSGNNGVTSQDSSNTTGQPPKSPYRQLVNQNLEQISDWLTKILVGLGLIELQQLPAHLERVATFMMKGINNSFISFAVAMIIFFFITGFFGGYLATRLYFAILFSKADQFGEIGFATNDLKTIDKEEINFEPDQRKLMGQEAGEAAKKVVATSIRDLSTAEQMAIWAKAQLSEGNISKAIEGYALALAKMPDSIKTRLEYAITLDTAKRPVDEVHQQLLMAYKTLTPDTAKSLKEQLYRALIYQSLYLPPPEGFETAIKYGEEYIKDSSNTPSGAIYANLAAAYGQKYGYLVNNLNIHNSKNVGIPDLDEEKWASAKKEARDNALKNIQDAIKQNPQWQEKLKLLLQKDYPNKPVGENDLEVFADDSEFRQVLGLN